MALADYVLAQLNIARLLEPIDSPLLEDFVANIDRVNAIADESPGFVWRLQDEDGDATEIRHFGDNYIVNMSVWEDIDALRAFVAHPAHAEIMSRKRKWFERMREAYMVLWWVPRGHEPTEDEAREKLEALRANGPGPDAFTFKESYPEPQPSEENGEE